MAMLAKEYSFPIQIGQVLDFDLLPDLDLTAAIEGHNHRQVLVIANERWLISESWPDSWGDPDYPHIRLLSEERLLIVDTSPRDLTSSNAWILNRTAHPLQSFNIGIGVMDVVTFPKWFAVVYHPDAAFAQGFDHYPLSQGNIAIFDHQGKLRFTVDSLIQKEGWRMDPTVCASAHSGEEFIFVPEALWINEIPLHFPIVSVNLRTKKVSYWELPFFEPMALSSRGSAVFLFSPEHHEDQIVAYDLLTRQTEFLGAYHGIYRGLTRGRFLSQLTGSLYTLVDPANRQQEADFGGIHQHPN